MINAIVAILSAIAAAVRLFGMLVRIAFIGFIGAVALRIGGLVQPELLPAFWLMLGAALVVVVVPSVAYGEDQVRRTTRDRAIRKAVKEYDEG